MAAARAAAAAVTLMDPTAMAAEDTAVVEVEDTVVVVVVVTAAGTFSLSFPQTYRTLFVNSPFAHFPFQPALHAIAYSPGCSSLRHRTNNPK